jgi:hypothetical protein
MDAGLKELNWSLLAFYDSPEYRQLFAAYYAPSVEASYRAREAAASRYRRHEEVDQPETGAWDILAEGHVTNDAILRDVDATAAAKQSEFAAAYVAELERGIAALQQTNRELLARVAEQRRFTRDGSAESSREQQATPAVQTSRNGQ